MTLLAQVHKSSLYCSVYLIPMKIFWTKTKNGMHKSSVDLREKVEI